VIDRALGLYPIVINHKKYQNKHVGCIQLPTVVIRAEKNSSIKSICLQFLQTIDREIGTTYKLTYGRLSADGMVSAVATLCHLHAIGLIVLDEIQELTPTKSGGANAIVSFLLNLTNRMDTGVLFVGTPQALLFMRGELRYIRRSSGIPEWRPMEETSTEWKVFMNELWRNQYTRTPTFLSDPIRAVLFALTKGIPDFAIELYKKTQRKLIQHAAARELEVITPEFVEQIGLTYLSRDIEALIRLKICRIPQSIYRRHHRCRTAHPGKRLRKRSPQILRRISGKMFRSCPIRVRRSKL
jgi:AAA domain